MVQTVENGTGGAAKVAGYQVGGKTGTAEKQPRSAKNYLVSFAGFAPVDDPQLFVVTSRHTVPLQAAFSQRSWQKHCLT